MNHGSFNFSPVWEERRETIAPSDRHLVERMRALDGWVLVSEWEDYAWNGEPLRGLLFRRAAPHWLIQARSDEVAGRVEDSTGQP